MNPFDYVNQKINAWYEKRKLSCTDLEDWKGVIAKFEFAKACDEQLKNLHAAVGDETFKEIFGKSMLMTEGDIHMRDLLGFIGDLDNNDQLRSDYAKQLDAFNRQFIHENVQKLELKKIVKYAVGFRSHTTLMPIHKLVDLMNLDVDAPANLRHAEITSEFNDVTAKESNAKESKWYDIDVEESSRFEALKYAESKVVRDCEGSIDLARDIYREFFLEAKLGTPERRKYYLYVLLSYLAEGMFHIIKGQFGMNEEEFPNDQFMLDVLKLEDAVQLSVEDFMIIHAKEINNDPIIIKMLNMFDIAWNH